MGIPITGMNQRLTREDRPRGDPGADANPYPEQRGQGPSPAGGGGNTEDLDDDIPFIRMDGLPW